MRICSIENQARAGLIASRLKDEGLHPLPLNISAHISIGGADRFYYIEVPEKETPRARMLLTLMGYERDLLS